MKSIAIFTTSLLVSSLISMHIQCQDTPAAAPETRNIISSITYLPISLAKGVLSLITSGTDLALQGGSKIVEGVGNGLTKVGNVGSSIITTSQEHPALSGLVGLTAFVLFLKKTEVGRLAAQRVYKALQALFGLNEEEMKCACADHRTMALYLQ